MIYQFYDVMMGSLAQTVFLCKKAKLPFFYNFIKNIILGTGEEETGRKNATSSVGRNTSHGSNTRQS
jgi:hypothetical protein